MRKFLPLRLGLVEEGELLEEFDETFKKVQRNLIEHVKRFRAGGKASVSLTVSLGVTDVEQELFSVETKVSSKLPSRPARMTLATIATDDDGQETLFCRVSGTTAEEPRQGRLCTDDGRAVDHDTGEVLARQTEAEAG